ncbi:MAG: tRNA preQ1(34) S-adenosylmethionine ribosyltransferase-isomerase QueA [Synergistaceae bacterium]|nr:tRNA preQ1(34) S-adenosylmethionine ribosyltransferase-isomerase QueA [Synergistaceae bacterium]
MNDIYSLSSYDYELPENLIAQDPASPRDSSRLLALDASKKTIEHRIFRDITEYIGPGDLLVLNDTRVIPARIRAPGSKSEILLLRPTADINIWQALAKPARKLQSGTRFEIEGGTIEMVGKLPDGVRLVSLSPPAGKTCLEWIEEIGETPLPPYIKRSTAPRDSYQTVFARDSGSAAAPTASLHFTNELLDKIKSLGVKIAYVTLHVGLGTFRPVRAQDIREHVMHHELCTIPYETAQAVLDRKKNGGRVIAGGTTVMRTLESFAPGEYGTKETDLFITHGFEFKAADALITNFHTPKSSLLMLVSAFIGDHDFLMDTYKEAVRLGYRFFSFGDAMFIKKT